MASRRKHDLSTVPPYSFSTAASPPSPPPSFLPSATTPSPAIPPTLPPSTMVASSSASGLQTRLVSLFYFFSSALKFFACNFVLDPSRYMIGGLVDFRSQRRASSWQGERSIRSVQLPRLPISYDNYDSEFRTYSNLKSNGQTSVDNCPQLDPFFLTNCKEISN